jgi:hypothetical protein
VQSPAAIAAAAEETFLAPSVLRGQDEGLLLLEDLREVGVADPSPLG